MKRKFDSGRPVKFRNPAAASGENAPKINKIHEFYKIFWFVGAVISGIYLDVTRIVRMTVAGSSTFFFSSRLWTLARWSSDPIDIGFIGLRNHGNGWTLESAASTNVIPKSRPEICGLTQFITKIEVLNFLKILVFLTWHLTHSIEIIR